MSPYTVWQSENFSIAQSYDFPLPGYLFVECTSGVTSLSELKAAELAELSHVLQRAESLIDSLIKPARTYVLKLGESDQRLHFHLIPRTKEVLAGYLRSTDDKPPYNGALITAWIWSNVRTLGHTDEDINRFIRTAREAGVRD